MVYEVYEDDEQLVDYDGTDTTAVAVNTTPSAATSCFEPAAWRRASLFQASPCTTAHKLVGLAAILGFLFAVLHLVTIIVTVLSAGADWGATAWSMDIMGYLAGVGFAFLCRNASNVGSSEGGQETFWIFVWSAITLFVRILDILMLTGVVEIKAIYDTPKGPTLYANIVSEIIVAFPYTALALAGSALLLRQARSLARGADRAPLEVS